ncbi:tetratricopeptide repeat protein [Sulfurimonas marina]|uniref:Tetratricopeptide repeat protein n=1 Tax=Sulfurimonas marina TaxID=2590551 RepID=A0A7M1AWQ5_9BACT|nr:tetratricopeptide repeat protein [Sulfurimonas marina]QOP41860.1 tetratricopeptide repeat protein [Sulfurimonas marina]
MANEQEEEIIIIEDMDAIKDASDHEVQDDTDDTSNKKLIIFISIAVILITLILAVIMFSSSSDEELTTLTSQSVLEEKLKTPQEIKVEPSKLEKMIAKANYLYSNGDKLKALSLYQKIAQYSQAISMYNLGVAQLKDKQYKLALDTFQKAIENDEKRCVSAINAAVCSLYLKDKESFSYYIDLAYAYLPYEINSPLYSYYYTLINYYKRDYLSALNSLNNGTTQTYPIIQNNLKAKINALYENNYDAIDAIEINTDDINDFSLGLLYARVGDVNLAVKHFEASLLAEKEVLRSRLAMAFTLLKAGQVEKATITLKKASDKFPDEITKPYPVIVNLKESLFDPKEAQKTYRNVTLKSKNIDYQKIFYYSPYKMFNADQTISYIRKGNANTFIDNIKSAQEYLKKSSSSSNVNKGMTIAIKKALNLQLREANEDFQKLVTIQPKHSILQYNLGLTYAQLGNLNKAHEHFLRSYYLDSKNFLAGLYAVFTAQLTNNKYLKLRSILSDSIHMENDGEEKELYKTLLAISENNYLLAADWFQVSDKKRPLYLVLNAIIATHTKNYDVANAATSELVSLLPNDILPHIMYMDTHFHNYDDVKYAKEIISYLKDQSFDYNDLYYGPYITRYLYIQTNLLTGKLYYLRQQLKEKLATSDSYTLEIENTLALASLYDKQFEESYSLYNHLIDERKVTDAYTLYLGAVASTAAGHHSNAIALLELAKIKNRSFYESRLALALLYLEARNYEAAIIQLSGINSNNYRSNYFDFGIDTQKLLFEKQHQEK